MTLTKYQQFFTGRSTIEIAKDLLGKLLVYDGPDGRTSGYIVEDEAYLGITDSASHAYGGRRTGYTESLYGEPGNIYLYQIRGRYCFDIVVQDKDNPQGILLRGIEPLTGIELMEKHRQGMHGVAVSNGPAKLIQALGISSRELDGRPMIGSPLQVKLNDFKIPREIITTSRIGVNMRGKDGSQPRRFYVAGNPFVSGMRKRGMNLKNHGWKEK